MKYFIHKLILTAIICMLALSCSAYQQIISMRPVDEYNCTQTDLGYFVYTYGTIDFIYDFWTEGGNAGFTVVNNGDSDIFIDLSKSFLIKNSIAYDYFRSRSWSYNITNTPSTGNWTFSSSNLQTISHNVIYTEKSVICIPSKSSKVIKEYDILSSPHRECGFNRYPTDHSTKSFSKENTPVYIENRICIIEDDTPEIVRMAFYGAEFTNIGEHKVMQQHDTRQDCLNDNGYIIINKMSSPDKFYIKYIQNGGNDTGKGLFYPDTY